MLVLFHSSKEGDLKRGDKGGCGARKSGWGLRFQQLRLPQRRLEAQGGTQSGLLEWGPSPRGGRGWDQSELKAGPPKSLGRPAEGLVTLTRRDQKPRHGPNWFCKTTLLDPGESKQRDCRLSCLERGGRIRAGAPWTWRPAPCCIDGRVKSSLDSNSRSQPPPADTTKWTTQSGLLSPLAPWPAVAQAPLFLRPHPTRVLTWSPS